MGNTGYVVSVDFKTVLQLSFPRKKKDGIIAWKIPSKIQISSKYARSRKKPADFTRKGDAQDLC